MPSRLVNAMVLSTVSKDHKPSSRVVLLKEWNSNGFIFYTNYQSQKGMDIQDNPWVSLLFWWEDMERQVCIEGVAERLSTEESNRYFQTRPKASQIAACASQQSRELPQLEDLEKQVEKLQMEYADEHAVVPRPEHWGGYIVKPERFEYWQGRESRLHDRFQYTRSQEKWRISRLYP